MSYLTVIKSVKYDIMNRNTSRKSTSRKGPSRKSTSRKGRRSPSRLSPDRDDVVVESLTRYFEDLTIRESPPSRKRTKLRSSPRSDSGVSRRTLQRTVRLPAFIRNALNTERIDETVSHTYGMTSAVYVDLWTMYAIHMTGKGCFVRDTPADASLNTGIALTMNVGPPFNVEVTIGGKRLEDIQKFTRAVQGCIERGRRVIVPIAIVYRDRPVGHMNGIIIDPLNKRVFYYDPGIFYDPTRDAYFRAILEAIKTHLFVTIPHLNEYVYEIPDLRPEMCHMTLQVRMMREVNAIDTNCQYYTLLALITFLMNDVLPLYKVLERLHRLETEEIRRSILILQRDFITWIIKQYEQFYDAVSKNPYLVYGKLPVNPSFFIQMVANPSFHAKEEFTYSMRMFRMYLYRIVQ